MVTRCRLAETTGIDFGQVIADRAENNSLFHFAQGRDQPLNLSLGRAHQMESQTLRRLVTNAGQAFQFVDEFYYWFSVF